MKESFKSIENLSLSYDFSPSEIASLALFFRKNQDILPEELNNFSIILEKKIYETLSIEEIKRFYS